MRFKACLATCLFAIGALAALPQSATAQNDLIFLSRIAGPTEIPFDRLTGNDGIVGSQSTIIFSPPSRGVLGIGPNSVTYTPGSTFQWFGLDSFQYSYSIFEPDQNENVILATVFLVADLKVDLAYLDLSNTDFPVWSTVNLPAPPIATGEAQSFTAKVSVQDSFLAFAPPADPQPPSGGTLLFDLDPGRCNPCITTLARISFGTGNAFELKLTDSNRIFARAWLDDGGYVDTSKFYLPSGRAEITWWLEHVDGSANGGLILVIDGEFMAELTDLENRGFLGLGGFSQSVGSMESTGRPGEVDFFNLQMWTSDQPLRYKPQFAEGAESDRLDSWSSVSSLAQVAVTAPVSSLNQRAFSVSPVVGDSATMVLSELKDENSLRLRFMLEPYSVAAKIWTRLVVATDPTSSTTAFEIEMRRTTDRVKLRLLASPDDGPQARSAWLVFFNGAGPLQVDLAWWAATTTSAGGVTLQANSVANTAWQNTSLSLNNSSVRVDQISFGATNTTSNSTATNPKPGFLLLDDIEIWY